MTLHVKDLAIAIAKVAAENLILPISTTVEEIEGSLIAAGQGDMDDSRWRADS